ncbi:MAG: lysoplasmalogenase [Ferruginibacter sp.]
MRQIFKSYGFIIFWLIAFIDIIAAGFDADSIRMVTKPVLMPVLIFVVLSVGRPGKKRFLMIAGLFFSFLGDVFLLYEKSNTLFFVFGLFCFLLTHILYIWFFLSLSSGGTSLLAERPFLILLVAAYSTSLIILLRPTLGVLFIPVVLYALFLSAMLLSAIHVYKKVSLTSARLFIGGALLFVASDSLLAVNKFYSPLPYAHFLIMASYCLAQYLIVKGFIKLQT